MIACASLASCGPGATVTEYVEIGHGVPRELVEPVEVAPRAVTGLQDALIVTADALEAVGRANGQLAAVSCILFPDNPVDPRACADGEPQR